MDCGNSGSNRGRIADPNLQRRFFLGLNFCQHLVPVQCWTCLGYEQFKFAALSLEDKSNEHSRI